MCVFCLFKLRLPFSEQFYVHSETDSRRGGPPCAPDTHRPSLCPHVTGGAFVVADELTGTRHRPRVRGRHQGGSRRGAFCGLGQTWSGAFPRSRGHTERPPCPKPAELHLSAPRPRRARHTPLCPHSRAFSRTPHSAQLLCHVHLGCSHVFSGLSNIPPSGRTPVYLPITYGGASRSTPGFNNYKYALLFTGKSGGTPPALLSYG